MNTLVLQFSYSLHPHTTLATTISSGRLRTRDTLTTFCGCHGQANRFGADKNDYKGGVGGGAVLGGSCRHWANAGS